MNQRKPVPGYRLLSIASTKLKLKDNHYQTPCRLISIVSKPIKVLVMVVVIVVVVFCQKKGQKSFDKKTIHAKKLF